MFSIIRIFTQWVKTLIYELLNRCRNSILNLPPLLSLPMSDLLLSDRPLPRKNWSIIWPVSAPNDAMADLAVERFAAPNGQYLFGDQVSVDAYWTSLDWKAKEVHAFYKQRGTSEQYHSELKSDMGVERLPSGKFAANQQILDLAMIAYNLLRLMGQNMLGSGLVPRRKAQSGRLRLRTVMQNLMYMAGRLVRHARRTVVKIFKGHGWAQPALALARGPDG